MGKRTSATVGRGPERALAPFLRLTEEAGDRVVQLVIFEERRCLWRGARVPHERQPATRRHGSAGSERTRSVRARPVGCRGAVSSPVRSFVRSPPSPPLASVGRLGAASRTKQSDGRWIWLRRGVRGFDRETQDEGRHWAAASAVELVQLSDRSPAPETARPTLLAELRIAEPHRRAPSSIVLQVLGSIYNIYSIYNISRSTSSLGRPSSETVHRRAPSS